MSPTDIKLKKHWIIRLLLSLVTGLMAWSNDMTILESLTLAIFVGYSLYFVSLLGRRIIVFELTVFLAMLTWLVVPVFFYNFFTDTYELAFIWDKFMSIPSDEYFSFALPATLFMAIGIHWPMSNKKILESPTDYFQEIKEFLKNKSVVGGLLIAIGLMTTLVTPYAPKGLGFVFYLLEHLSFVGILYLYFSKIPGRKWWLWIGGLALLIQAVSSAMFGELIYIGFLSLALLVSNRHWSSMRKWTVIGMGLIAVLLIQSVKHEYRSVAWSEGASSTFFFSAIGQKIVNPSEIIEPKSMFATAVRMNQGWLVAKTMYNVPRYHPYGNGTTIYESILAAFVPRLLWPNKPEAGGKANLKRFWGMEISGYSMNIGVIGEAYANFGRKGGIAFMFLYGLVLNMFLGLILKMVKMYPTILLWFPILFLYPVGTETDLLSTINPLVKITVFISALYLALPYLLKVRLG